jgi:hypothetical protein
MTDTTSMPDLRLDPEGVVAVDVPCRQCAYDLRGLPRDGRCPECGTPVAMSLWRWLIHFAPVEWLTRVVRGAMLCGTGMCLILASPFLAPVSRWYGDRVHTISLACAVAGVILDIAGTLAFTFPPPEDSRGRPFDLDSRKPPRVALGLTLALVALAAISLPEAHLLGGLAAVAAAVAFFAWHGLLLIYSRDLASLIPARKLEQWLTFTLTIIVSVALIAIPLLCAGAAKLDALGILIAAAVVGSIVLYLVMIASMWRRLRRELAVARQYDAQTVNARGNAPVSHD